jgi:hypothetical protein
MWRDGLASGHAVEIGPSARWERGPNYRADDGSNRRNRHLDIVNDAGEIRADANASAIALFRTRESHGHD